jgi:glycosyltransferase involved in cell wall biosynthesis
MKISVIVPVYNGEKYIHSTLISLLSQNIDDYEVVCVDDGSNDATSSILDAIVDIKLRVIHQPNLGVWKARHAGILAAKGEYITFCDSDDKPEINWLSLMYDRAIESDADITLCGFRRVDESTGRTISTEMVIKGEDDVSVDKIPLLFLNSSLWNKFFKAKLFENIFEPTIIPRVAEDTLFLASLYPDVKKIAFVPVVLYNYNIRTTSAISSVINTDLYNSRIAFVELMSVYPLAQKDFIAAIVFIHCAVVLPLLMNWVSYNLIKDTYIFLNKYLPNWKNILTLKYIINSKYKIKLLKIYIPVLSFKYHFFYFLALAWKFLTIKCGFSIKW